MGLQLATCRGIRRWVESIFGHAMKRNPVVEESSMGSFRSKLPVPCHQANCFGVAYPILKLTGIFQCKARKISVLSVSAYRTAKGKLGILQAMSNTTFLGYARPTLHNVIIVRL